MQEEPEDGRATDRGKRNGRLARDSVSGSQERASDPRQVLDEEEGAPCAQVRPRRPDRPGGTTRSGADGVDGDGARRESARLSLGVTNGGTEKKEVVEEPPSAETQDGAGWAGALDAFRSEVEMTAPRARREPDWRTIRREILTVLGGRMRAPKDRLEDAAQDALLCLVILADRGENIGDPVALGVTVARKRLIDDARKRWRRGERVVSDLDGQPKQHLGNYAAADWATCLRRAGWKPTEAWSRILTAISSGARGTNKIAEVLGRNPKTILESRRRLQQWLHEKIATPHPSERLEE